MKSAAPGWEPGAPPLLERDIQRTVCDFLRAHGWRLVRLNVTKMPIKGQWVSFGERGMPDYLALYYLPDGRAVVLWLEFKRPKGKAAEHQQLWHEAERRLGAVVVQVDSFDNFLALYTAVFEREDSPVKGQRRLL
jgi:hypothetical protein